MRFTNDSTISLYNHFTFLFKLKDSSAMGQSVTS